MENVPAPARPRRSRIASVDILRGLVIVLMAVDHIRDMFAITPERPENMDPLQAGWFFTRWITHFCAPVFVFLAGTAAFLYGDKVQDKKALSRFLLSRGIFLILIEVLVINMSWTLMLSSQAGFLFVQVIWAIGWSMVVLAGLVWLPRQAIAVFALALIAGHNLLDGTAPEAFGAFDWLWKVLHVGMAWIPFNEAQSFGVLIVYPLIPWIGVMAAGYLFGGVLTWESPRRLKALLTGGLVLTALLLLLRFLNVYGDPRGWSVQGDFAATLMSFLNTEKYPPSLLFLLMTIGPALLLLVWFEKKQGWWSDVLMVFGRVPFFFYILHFPILSLLAVGWHYVRYGRYLNFFMTPPDAWPEEYTPQLWLVWLVWLLFLPPMYFLCRWYGKYKATHDYWWLKYL